MSDFVIGGLIGGSIALILGAILTQFIFVPLINRMVEREYKKTRDELIRKKII